MKKIVLIFGSPHEDGPTAALVNACLAGFREEVALTRFDCFATAPHPCDDCRACHTVDGCRYHDLDALYEAVESADGLLFATPVYNRSFPAPMKALLDRLQRYWAARFVRGMRPPIAIPKKAVLLTAGGAARMDGTFLQAQLAPILTVLHSTPAVAVHAADTDSAPLSADILAAATTAGQHLMA